MGKDSSSTSNNQPADQVNYSFNLRDQMVAPTTDDQLEFNACVRSRLAILLQSSLACLGHNLARLCNPAPPVHGQRVPRRVR
jgi:hypothetical protein